MKTMLREAEILYEKKGWVKTSPSVSFEDFIMDITDKSIFISVNMNVSNDIMAEKRKGKLSSLRGKLSLKEENEIDTKFSEIRDEWNRCT